MVLGRANLIQLDIQVVVPAVACRPYPIPLKYHKFVNEEIKLLENGGCISKTFTSMGYPSYHST